MPILIPRSHIVQLDEPRVFLVKDDFTDNLAAGSVNNTSVTPGPDVRVVVDTDGDGISVGAGALTFANPNSSTGDPGLWYGAVTRAAGIAMYVDHTLVAGTQYHQIGFDTGQAGSLGDVLFNFDATQLQTKDGGSTNLFAYTDVRHELYIILRAAGAFYCTRGGPYSDWTLQYVGSTFAGATLYPAATTYLGRFAIDTLRTMQLGAPWSDTYAIALAFATFTAANGTAIAAYPPEVGSQWAATIGTWEIQGNAAQCSALVGGIAIATVDAGQVDTLHTAQPTVAGGIAGIVLRYVDAANYVYAIHDGTNARLTKRVAGVETDMIDAAAAYGAGRELRVIADGTIFDLFYNNVRIGVAQTIADAGLQTSTLVGLLTTDVTNTFAAADTYPRDITGYARLELRKYIR